MSKLRNRHFFLFALVLLASAVYLSFVLRLERIVFNNHLPAYLLLTAAVIVVYPLLFRHMGVHSRYWQYASIDEVVLLTGAVTLTVLVANAAAYITPCSWSLRTPLDPLRPAAAGALCGAALGDWPHIDVQLRCASLGRQPYKAGKIHHPRIASCER